MTPEEAESRRRHPVNRGGVPAPLRAVHSDTHSGGQESSRGIEKAAGWLPLLFVVLLAGGVLAAIWLHDWRWAASGLLLSLVVAFVGARHDRT